MKKTAIFLLISLLAFATLTGCGNNENTTDAPSSTPTVEPSPTDEPTTEGSIEALPTETSTPTETPVSTETPTPIPTEPPHEHNYTEVEGSEVAATCTTDGKKADKVCECGDKVEGEVVKAIGHNYESVASSAKKPTCEADGKKADEVCTLCGDTINGEAISATGHSYGNYVYNNDATVEKNGTETAKCSTCGKTKTRTKEGTKLEPETHWYDGYARGVWHDMGEYMFWIGNTMEEANNMAMCNDALDKAAILRSRYPDRQAYIGAGMQGGVPTAFTSTNKDNPFWRPTFIWE